VFCLGVVVLSLTLLIAPLVVGGSIDPCTAAANAAMPKARPSLYPQATMRDFIASRLKSEGLPMCYWAVARALAGH
jgi:hypothetical protein